MPRIEIDATQAVITGDYGMHMAFPWPDYPDAFAPFLTELLQHLPPDLSVSYEGQMPPQVKRLRLVDHA